MWETSSASVGRVIVRKYILQMAAEGSPVSGNQPQLSQGGANPPIQEPKTAGMPLSDFVLQLDDYAPTVSFFKSI